jgi:hypothetical protein
VVKKLRYWRRDPDSILGRNGLYTFGCMPWAPWEWLTPWIVRYYKISRFIFFLFNHPQQPAQRGRETRDTDLYNVSTYTTLFQVWDHRASRRNMGGSRSTAPGLGLPGHFTER